MNVSALIDAIVRQTTHLIARLATSGGARAQLAHTPNQVFLDLAEALRKQGLSSKVIADMFGLALRTYQDKVRRLSESRTVRGRSLWEAVLEHIDEQGPVLRAALLQRFRHDDPANVRGVLKDLVKSGLVYRTGTGERSAFRSASAAELGGRFSADTSREVLNNLVWVTVQRLAPASLQEVAAALSASPEVVEVALQELQDRGLVQVREGAPLRYQSRECVLPYEDELGWEAAVFDHYQAMVTALSSKLDQGRRLAQTDDTVGGSTFGFEVWPGHPQFEEVTGLLRELRQRGSTLRQQVARYNQSHAPSAQQVQVITYVGQTIVGPNDVQPSPSEEKAK